MASKFMASKRIGCALRKLCAKFAADTTYQANAKQAEASVQHTAEIFGQRVCHGEKSVDAKLASLVEEFKRMQDHHFDKLKFEVEKQHLESRNELWKNLEDRETRSREAFEDVHSMMSKHAEDLHHKVKKDLHRYYLTVCGIVIGINLLKSL